MRALLLVWILVSPAWCAAPFSHRIHLSQGLNCTFCHPAAPKSTSASDDLRPKREVCLNCHETPAIPPRENHQGSAPVVHFSHELHLRLGNVAPFIARAIDKGNYLQPSARVRPLLNGANPCEACHRGLEQSDRLTSAAFPQMADCLVCHTHIEPPFSCEDCHAKDAKIKPASHDERFLDAHSSGKLALDKTTCAVCHGRNFTCMGCH